MPELDYAFLAQWAGVQSDGTLTSVGMSFTKVQVHELGGMFSFALACRFRGHTDDPDIPLEVSVSSPMGERLRFDTRLPMPHENAYTDEGRTHALFAAQMQIPLTEEGLHRVVVERGGEAERELFFSVVLAPRPSADAPDSDA